MFHNAKSGAATFSCADTVFFQLGAVAPLKIDGPILKRVDLFFPNMGPVWGA
jgi:hypothetical protein